MTKVKLIVSFILLYFLTGSQLNAQKDTEFWFVAPEVTQGLNNYDRPVSFWISTYDASATVTLSQPANVSFPAQVLNLSANSSGRFTFPPLFDFIENTPANVVLNKGILIQSTSPITVYYEVIGQFISNPEIFSLKGRNALGESFYIPFQNLMPNSNAYSPLPHAAFDIVATEDNTTVNIIPSKDIVGHAAGVPFALILNRGETYSAQAASQLASEHPTGSRVTSDKPIAITIKDDLLESGALYGGFCRDLMGDQIVPVGKLGTRYILQKGLLNTEEHAFLVGTENGTQVFFDGVPAANVNAGETIFLPVSGKHFIETSAAVYVLQVTGNGCEIGGEIMPALGCSGSRSIRFVRPTDEPFLLFLTTETGNEGGFTLNGSATAIPANAFQPVSGSNGDYVAATILMDLTQVPTGSSSIVQNSISSFQMGFLNGQDGVTGCRYGFFSDFGNQVVIEQVVSFCSGDSLDLHGLTISESGLFETTVLNPQGCDTLFQIYATELDAISTQQEISICPGESIMIAGQVYSQPGTIVDTLAAGNGCDSIVTYTLILLPQIMLSEHISFCQGGNIVIGGQIYTESGTVIDTLSATTGCDTIITYTLTVLPLSTSSQTIVFCPGASVSIGGQTYTQAGTVIDTIPGTIGCDTIVTYALSVLPYQVRSETIEFCPGTNVTINGQTYTQAGTVIDTIPGITGCDTIVTYALSVLPYPLRSETIEFCPGASVTINGQTYTHAGTIIDTIPGITGCDTIVTYALSVLPYQVRSETIEFCPGESVMLGGETYTQPGIVLDTIPGTIGCDTIVTYTLQSTLPAPSVVTIQCPQNVSLIAEPGTAPLLATYNLPTATSDCPCPGISLQLTAGLASGSLFPNGITNVCYAAQDSCGHSASCCFTVTIREVQPCDVKVNGCMRYELLTITADPDQNRTYRIRVINNCANKLIYTAIQLPVGVTALAPANLSTFTSENGLEYEVRNPNFSPFYSVRFKSTSDSIFGGQSDIFEYTLPAQSVPVYMDITSRLAPQVFYEAHLNTFYCPVGMTSNKSGDGLQQVHIYPNPTSDVLWVDFGEWSKKAVQWRILNSQGQELLTGNDPGTEGLFQINLPQNLLNGLYFYELRSADGAKDTQRFMLIH